MEQIKKFIQKIEIQCYSESTKRTYKYHIQKFLDYYRDDTSQENIEKHLYYLRSYKHYSAESLNIVRAALFYYFQKILHQDITIKIEKIKRKKALPRPEDKEIIIKLIQNISNLKHRTLVELAYSSGLRPFEILKLKWDDLDIINKIVRVNLGKGRKDRLSILSDRVIVHLIDLKKSKPDNNKYVFYSNARPENHISKKTFQKILEHASEKAKLGYIVTPYQLRHSFATHLIEDHTDIRYIQELMGHSSIKTTERYTKVTKQKLMQIRSPLDTLDLTSDGGVKSNKEEVERVVNTNS